MWRYLLFLLLFQVSAFGQAETIRFGVVELKLGLSKQEVKSRLSGLYTGVWDADTTPVADLKADRMIGWLRFSQGKLVSVGKSWTPSNGDPVEFVKALHGLVSKFNKTGRTFALVTTAENRSPEMNVESVVIRFGARAIVVSAENGNLHDRRIRGVSIYEEIAEDPSLANRGSPRNQPSQPQP